MASDATVKAVNGNYGVQPAYATEQPSYSQSPAIASSAAPSGSFGADPSSVPNAASNTSAAGNEGGNNISKDEVGWYFVEQYYTTLSKSPEKLHVSHIWLEDYLGPEEKWLTYCSCFIPSGRNSYQESKQKKCRYRSDK